MSLTGACHCIVISNIQHNAHRTTEQSHGTMTTRSFTCWSSSELVATSFLNSYTLPISTASISLNLPHRLLSTITIFQSVNFKPILFLIRPNLIAPRSTDFQLKIGDLSPFQTHIAPRNRISKFVLTDFENLRRDLGHFFVIQFSFWMTISWPRMA